MEPTSETRLVSRRIEAKARALGADLFGVASPSAYAAATGARPLESILPGCAAVAVFALRFPSSPLAAGSTIPYTIARNRLSARIDDLSLELARFLEEEGFAALATGAIEPCDRDPASGRTVGIVSLKGAAYAAGLGAIGRNTLLITPEFGNLVWLGAVLTDAPLEPGSPAEGSPCGPSCSRCLDACPVGALDGSRLMDQRKCWDFAFGAPPEGGEWRIRCFACRAACPFAKGRPRGARADG